MANPQKTKFKSVDECIDSLPDDERAILEVIRAIIFDCIPEVKEKLAYNVPFYYRYSRICYLWPSSIPWGGIKSGVAIGYMHGNLMPSIKIKGHKNIANKVFHQVSEIDVPLLKQQIWEAFAIDEELYRNRKMKKDEC